MTIFGINLCSKEDREEESRPAKGQFCYRDSEGEKGHAKWFSMSATGACICIDQHLAAGRELTIIGEDIEVEGRIVWCRPMADKQNFVAGIRIIKQTGKAISGTVPMKAALLEA